MGPMTEAACPTCREPRVPLIRCATCDAMACELCLFTPDLICLRCNRRGVTATKEGKTMTLQDAANEMRATYPGRYVSVMLNVHWHTHAECPTLAVTLYAEGIGNVVYAAGSILEAITEMREKRGGSDLDTSDAQLAAMTEPAHVA